MEKIKSYKGFDKDLKCRGFQFEIGKEYEEENAEKCKSGFHACEYPLDVFSYYEPASSRFCEVEQSGKIDKEENGDTKIASTKIKIGAEIGIKGLIDASINFIMERAKTNNNKKHEDTDNSVASNSGDYSAAINSGYKSAAEITKEESISISVGIDSKAKGVIGSWLILSEWKKDNNYNWHRIDTKCKKIDGIKIKENAFYKLVSGKFVEVKE